MKEIIKSIIRWITIIIVSIASIPFLLMIAIVCLIRWAWSSEIEARDEYYGRYL